MFLFNFSTLFLFISSLDGQEDEEWAEERMDGWNTELLPAAVFGDLEGDRPGERQVKASKELRNEDMESEEWKVKRDGEREREEEEQKEVPIWKRGSVLAE